MQMPKNAAAMEIVRIRSVNMDIEEQILELRRSQNRNSEIIGALDLTAVWEEISDSSETDVDQLSEEPSE